MNSGPPRGTSFLMNSKIIAGLLLAVLLVSGPLRAAESTGDLRLVVIVARHGIRSPTSNAGQAGLGKYAAEPWPQWSVAPGQLTEHGKRQMRLMGAYYRLRYVHEGLLSGQAAEDASRLVFRADSDQRTIDTAQALAAGLLPDGHADVLARHPGESDPLFHPLEAAVGKPDSALAVAAVSGRLGDRPGAVVTACASAFAALERVLVGGDGTVPAGRTSVLSLPTEVVPDDKTPGAVVITGPLLIGQRCAEVFLLEYAEGLPLAQVGWGRIDRPVLTELMRLHSLGFILAHGTFYVAQEKASNLMSHIGRSLEQAVQGKPVPGAIGGPASRLVVLAGHDTNMASLAGLLGISWWMDGTQQDPTLPGGALVFELRQRPADGRYFVRVLYVAQTLDQMRNLDPLTLEHPPAVVPVFVPQGSGAAPGYDIPLEQFQALLGRVIDPNFVLESST